MPKRYITHEKKMYKQNGGGFLDFFKKTDSVPSTTPDTSNGGGFLDGFFKKKPDSVPSTTPDTSNVPSTTQNPLNNNRSEPVVIPSDEFLLDESKTYLITATLPNGNFMKVNINNNIVEINKRQIKGIKEVETSSGNLVYKGTDVETEQPIVLNKRLLIEFEDITTGGKRKSRRNRKSRQNQRKKSRQSRRR